MIEERQGNILNSGAEALVNTVNTVGVMGKGIALQFKEEFPENFRQYKAACDRGEVTTGRMLVVALDRLDRSNRYIINFPTKQHFRSKSKYAYLQEGLADLRRVIAERGIQSVAVPPLGAGNGGLQWTSVRALIYSYLEGLTCTIELYPPHAGIYQQIERRTGQAAAQWPRLTANRTLLLNAIDRYQVLDFEATLQEVQKLAYFLQRLGAGFHTLQYQQGQYGPYAHGLTHALDNLEGYYIEGMKHMEARPLDGLTIKAEQRPALHRALEGLDAAQQEGLRQLEAIIDGFESPYGLELLATVDWVMQHKVPAPADFEAVKQAVGNWNAHKAKMTSHQLRVAHERLLAQQPLGYNLASPANP
jgi:O-acetyl-ADP-ribose deacetylase (regulator of RNase III)